MPTKKACPINSICHHESELEISSFDVHCGFVTAFSARPGRYFFTLETYAASQYLQDKYER